MSGSSSDAEIGAGRRVPAPADGVGPSGGPAVAPVDGDAPLDQPHVGVPARYRRDGKVVEGLDGRLFVANDDNGALQQYTGERYLEDWKLDLWGKLFRRRLEALERLGAQYLFVIAPDSHPVYPELLPPDVERAPERPVDQLLRHLDEERIPVRSLYPLDVLLERKRERIVYPETDSHWDEYGAFVAYERLVAELAPLVPVRRLTQEQVLFYEISVPGDLGYKLEPVRTSPHAIAAMRHRSARLVYDNCIENRGSFIVTECPAAPPTTCVLLGDSYTYGLLKFLSESFRRLVFGETPKLDLELIEREQPDLVISMMVERHLVGVPDDVNGESLVEFEQRKRREGRLRGRAENWDGPEKPTPGTVERLRAELLAEGRLRDATMISVMAYAGLRPGEMLRLRWSDVEESELVVRPYDPAGDSASGAGVARRARLLAPLAADLRDWRAARAPADQDNLVFGDVGSWTEWRDGVFVPAAEACGLEVRRPFELRHVFLMLLLHEGESVYDVAAQLGSAPEDIYVRSKLGIPWVDQVVPVSAEREIEAARAQPF